MNTRKIKVLTSPPKRLMARPGSWKELLFSRMKIGNCFVAKLNNSHKQMIYQCGHQCKGKFEMKTLPSGETLVKRVR